MQIPTPLNDHVTLESAARLARRHRRREYDNVAASRSNVGHKSNQLHIKLGGYVDQGSAVKNAWDDAIRSLVPRLLDMSVIEWEGQRPKSLQKLREALDQEFEYLDCPLSMRGFKDAMKRFMKIERSRLKAKYLAGDTQCPLHIQPAQWINLQTYWGESTQVEKVEKMANARKQVRSTSHVGRKGRGG
jgi:hypothetical protein